MTANNLQQFWKEMVLPDFQHRMTQDTFNTWLANSCLLAQDHNTFTIQVNNEFTRDLLQGKHRAQLCTALQPIAPGEPQLKFVVSAPAPAFPSPVADPLPTPAVQPPDLPAIAHAQSDPDVALAHQIDFERLWQRSGFSQIPDYAAQFYRIHLGRAFELWEYLISLDKRDVKKMKTGEIPYWTPSRNVFVN